MYKLPEVGTSFMDMYVIQLTVIGSCMFWTWDRWISTIQKDTRALASIILIFNYINHESWKENEYHVSFYTIKSVCVLPTCILLIKMSLALTWT